MDKPSKEIADGCINFVTVFFNKYFASQGNQKEEDKITGACMPSHKFRENHEVEILVTRYLLTQDTDFCRQRIEKLVPG